MDPSLLQSTPKFQLPLPLQLEPASSTLTTAYSQQMLQPAWQYSSHVPLFSGHAIFLSYAPSPLQFSGSWSWRSTPGPLFPCSQKSSKLVQAGAFLPAPWFSFQWLRHRNSNRPKHSLIPMECWEDLWVYPATRETKTWELNRLACIANKKWDGQASSGLLVHTACLWGFQGQTSWLCSWNIHRTEELGFLICFLLLWQRTTKNNLGRRVFISVFTKGRNITTTET